MARAMRKGRCRVNGDAIRAAREAKGWTATDLGHLLGVVERTVYRYEDGTSAPILAQALRMRTLLDLSDEHLFVPAGVVPSSEVG